MSYFDDHRHMLAIAAVHARNYGMFAHVTNYTMDYVLETKEVVNAFSSLDLYWLGSIVRPAADIHYPTKPHIAAVILCNLIAVKHSCFDCSFPFDFQVCNITKNEPPTITTSRNHDTIGCNSPTCGA